MQTAANAVFSQLTDRGLLQRPAEVGVAWEADPDPAVVGEEWAWAVAWVAVAVRGFAMEVMMGTDFENHSIGSRGELLLTQATEWLDDSRNQVGTTTGSAVQ